MFIKFRDKGLNVQTLQTYLAEQNFYKGRIDNDFGEATLAAVIAFQQKNDLIPDGIVGDLTWAALLRTPKKRTALKPQDFSLAAEKLGVELAAVYAVTSVESAGRGFLPSGHPVVLFERHHFFKNCAPEKIALAQQYSNLYNKNAGGYIAVPSGFLTDLASVPSVANLFIPPFGKHSPAAVFHDWCYEQPSGYHSKAFADALFFALLKWMKVGSVKAAAMYAAVKIGGRGNYQ
jgi:hypothetical protein